MKKLLAIVCILVTLCLTACKPSASLQETDFPAPPEPPVTEAPRPEIPWDVPEIGTAPSYEAYFSESIAYIVRQEASVFPTTNWISGGNVPDHRLTYESPHLYLDNNDGVRLWEVAEIPDLRVVLYDPYWIYAIEGGTDLFRMDYYGQNREILFQDNTGLISKLNASFYLADGKVMFFFAGDPEGGASVYRLYLPEMKLDTMYHYDGAALESFFFAAPNSREQLSGNEDTVTGYHIGSCMPVSNHEVTWVSYNPEFYALLSQLAEDPEWYGEHFGNLEIEFDMCIGNIETEYQTLHQTDHYYNSLTDTYLSRGAGVFTGSGGYDTWWKSQ